MASSTVSGQGSGAMGHTLSEVRRASFSLFAQHTVTCEHLGFLPPPEELNFLIAFSSAPTVINPSPMRAANWALRGPAAATYIAGGCFGSVYTRAFSRR